MTLDLKNTLRRQEPEDKAEEEDDAASQHSDEDQVGTVMYLSPEQKV